MDANGSIAVRAGNRIPGVAQHTFKLRLEYEVQAGWTAAANLIHASGVWARGDENNSDAHGRLPGYTLLNLDAQARIGPSLTVFAGVNNVLDRDYHNFGLLGSNYFTGPGRTFGPAYGSAPLSEQFVAVGTPREFRAGLRYTFR